MALYFLTGNKGKFAEAKVFFPEVKQLSVDVVEIQTSDLRALVEAKLRSAMEHCEGDFFVEDTAAYVSCLNGLPGPFIRFFLESLSVAGLTELVHKYDDHRARIVSLIGYCKRNGDDYSFHYFEGDVEGTIVAPRGDKSFGWSPAFLPDGAKKTFGEMEKDEKNKWSMRGKAFLKLQAFLEREAS